MPVEVRLGGFSFFASLVRCIFFFFLSTKLFLCLLFPFKRLYPLVLVWLCCEQRLASVQVARLYFTVKDHLDHGAHVLRPGQWWMVHSDSHGCATWWKHPPHLFDGHQLQFLQVKKSLNISLSFDWLCGDQRLDRFFFFTGKLFLQNTAA